MTNFVVDTSANRPTSTQRVKVGESNSLLTGESGKRSRRMSAEVTFYLLKTNAHFNGTSADIKLRPSLRVTPRSAGKQRADSLGGYGLSTIQKTLADESVWEIDGGENRRGKGAAWHCFPFCIQTRRTCPPPCMNSMSARGYDRSSDRDVVLLRGCMTFFL